MKSFADVASGDNGERGLALVVEGVGSWMVGRDACWVVWSFSGQAVVVVVVILDTCGVSVDVGGDELASGGDDVVVTSPVGVISGMLSAKTEEGRV